MAILSFDSAKVAELADAPDLGSGTERCGGSSPPFRTKKELVFGLGSLVFDQCSRKAKT
jgi:hypothetical protein